MDGGTDSRRAVRRGFLEGQPSTPSDSGQGPSAFYAVSRKRRGASRAPKCMRFPWTAAHALRTRGPAPGPAQAAPSRTPRAPVLWPGFGRSSPAPPVAPPLEGSTSSRPVRQPRPRTLVDRLGGGICLPRLELVVPTCRLVGGAGGRCAPSVCVAAHGPSELVRAHSVRYVSPRGAPGFSTSRPPPLQHRYSSLGPVGRAVTVSLVPVSPALPQGAAVQCEPRTAPSSISSSLGRVIRVA